jgi:hypothetical protein
LIDGRDSPDNAAVRRPSIKARPSIFNALAAACHSALDFPDIVMLLWGGSACSERCDRLGQ